MPHRSQRIVVNFNRGWLFAAGDIAAGQSVALNEAAFQSVCLPHSTALVKHLDVDQSSFAKITWYRKHFTPPAEFEGRHFSSNSRRYRKPQPYT